VEQELRPALSQRNHEDDKDYLETFPFQVFPKFQQIPEMK